MDGILGIQGGETVDVELAGRKFTLSTKTLRNYAEIENFILNRRPDVYRTALDWVASLPDAMRGGPEIRSVVESAMRIGSRARFATVDELDDYNRSISGSGHRLWLAAREAHPDLTVEQATEVCAKLTAAEWRRLESAIDKSDQTDSLKNSSGPAESESRAETKAE